MNYLKDYREGEKFVGTYLCKQKQILKTKAGKTYYSLTLQDKTGTADGKIWELNNGIANFEPMDYIHCEGMVTSFQGNLQMNISRVRISDEGARHANVYSTLPAGMETTVKLDVEGTMLTAVVFGDVDYPVDCPVKFDFSKTAILFDKATGKNIACGTLELK